MICMAIGLISMPTESQLIRMVAIACAAIPLRRDYVPVSDVLDRAKQFEAWIRTGRAN